MKTHTKLMYLALPGIALVAGCGSGHHSASATSTTTPAVTTTVPVTSGSSTTMATTPTTVGTTTTTPSTTQPSGPQPCPTSSLGGSLTNPNGAAGTVYYDLRLTNTGSVPCTLYGYDGVSLVTGSAGTQVGAAARRDPGTVAAVTLAPGQAATSLLGIVEAANYGSACGITSVSGLRVYPPGETAALFIPYKGSGCTNPSDVVIHVGPVTKA